MHLFRLTYFSKTNLSSDGEEKPQQKIKSILDDGLAANKDRNITGALIFNKDYFVEIIEGSREEVSRTFAQIAKDNRHSDPVILECTPVDARQFDCWSMSYAGSSPQALAVYQKFGSDDQLRPENMTAASLIGLIEELIALDIKVADDSREREATTPQPPNQQVSRPATRRSRSHEAGRRKGAVYGKMTA